MQADSPLGGAATTSEEELKLQDQPLMTSHKVKAVGSKKTTGELNDSIEMSASKRNDTTVNVRVDGMRKLVQMHEERKANERSSIEDKQPPVPPLAVAAGRITTASALGKDDQQQQVQQPRKPKFNFN